MKINAAPAPGGGARSSSSRSSSGRLGAGPPASGGYRRRTGSRPRIRRHAIGAGIVAAYLAAAGIAVIAHGYGLPLWLALHLLVLGAATNAVFVWTWHFAEALLHAPPRGERAAWWRLGLLNAGVAAVLAGVAASEDGARAGWDALAAAGAAVVIAAVAWHVAGLASMARRSALSGRLRIVVWYYLAGGAALMAGAALGGVLALDVIGSPGLDAAARLAHAHLNLLGWLGFAIVGTEFMLWPAVLRTRMADNAPQWAGRVLCVASAGLAVAVAGLFLAPYLAAGRWVAVGGMAGYGAGVAGALVPAVAEMRVKPPHTCAAWALLGGNAWLLAAIGLDAAALAHGLHAADQALSGAIAPMLALGVVAQTLTGALTFLLPVVVGGGPAGNRALTAILERGWRARALAANTGVLLLALRPGQPAIVAGWVLVLAGFGAFAALVILALARRPARTDSSPAS